MRFALGAGLSLAAITVAVGVAQAHHSTAEFNYAETVILRGTIKEVQWTNPHSYVQVLVPGAGGATEQWGVEIGAPAINVRMGWKRDSVKAGDAVTLDIAPARDGRRFGTLRTLTFADGSTLNGVAIRVRPTASGSIVE